MRNISKCFGLVGAGAVGISGLAVIAYVAKVHAGIFGKAGKKIDKKLKESKGVLHKATEQVGEVLEKVKGRTA